MEDPFRSGGKILIASKYRDLEVYGLSYYHLDLFQAISSSSSEVQTVLEFLQRRKLEANKVCFL